MYQQFANYLHSSISEIEFNRLRKVESKVKFWNRLMQAIDWTLLEYLQIFTLLTHWLATFHTEIQLLLQSEQWNPKKKKKN